MFTVRRYFVPYCRILVLLPLSIALWLYVTSLWWAKKPPGDSVLTDVEVLGVMPVAYMQRIHAIAESEKIAMLNIHSKRIKTLHDYCLNNTLKYFRPRNTSPMLGVRQLNLWYCPIAKSASTSWKYFFGTEFTNECNTTRRENIHVCADKGLAINASRPAFNLSMIAVKNPWRRLVSAYIDKISLQRSRGYVKPFYDFFKVPLSSKEPISFQQFIYYITLQMRSKRIINWHFSPQFQLCDFCGRERSQRMIIAADALSCGKRGLPEEAAHALSCGKRGLLEEAAHALSCVKVETLMRDFRHVMLEAGVSNRTIIGSYERTFLDAPRESHEVRNVSSSMYCCFYKSLDNRTMSELIRQYRQDAEAFGYDSHPLEGKGALMCSSTVVHRDCVSNTIQIKVARAEANRYVVIRRWPSRN